MKERGGDLQAYFNAYETDAGSKKVISKASNALVRGEIRSMEQLCGMAYKELLRVRNLGKEGIKLVNRIRSQYLTERGSQGSKENIKLAEELNCEGRITREDIDVLKCFNAYAASAGSKKGIERVVNALILAGIHSMNQLCGMTYEELHEVRGIGVKGIELIALVRRQYLADTNLHSR